MTPIKCPPELLEAAESNPGEVEVYGPFIAIVGGIVGHTDAAFPEWSAFLTIRNDNCRVWQDGGYKGHPKPGERFLLNIHRRHGVGTARATGDAVLIVLCADGDTPEDAWEKLARYERAENPATVELEAA